MRYVDVVKGTFISRPNRFIAVVEFYGVEQVVHVKNTGRCKELLVEGATIYLSKGEGAGRKTAYDLIAVEKPPYLINIDSQAPNVAAYEWLTDGNLFSSEATVRREVTYGKSRFDLYVEDGARRAFVEVRQE